MLITRKSFLTKKVNTLDLPVTDEQLEAYRSGVLLQDAFPDLPVTDREFIKSGITGDEWALFFPPPK